MALGRRSERAFLARQRGILANQPETVDLEALRAHSTQVGDCRLMVDALRAQISAWDEKRNEPLSALRQALSAAEVEVNTLHQVERERRISEAREKLEEIRDWEKLRSPASFHTPNLDDLAQAARPVVEFDKIAIYSNGRYGWRYSIGDNELLIHADRLDAIYKMLVPLVEIV